MFKMNLGGYYYMFTFNKNYVKMGFVTESNLEDILEKYPQRTEIFLIYFEDVIKSRLELLNKLKKDNINIKAKNYDELGEITKYLTFYFENEDNLVLNQDFMTFRNRDKNYRRMLIFFHILKGLNKPNIKKKRNCLKCWN